MIRGTLYLIPLLILSFTGCVIPESNHVEPEYHLLTSRFIETNDSLRIPDISFHVREVSLPPYLDENRLVHRKSRSSINYLENHRWGEPLGEGISRVTGLNLSKMFDCLAFSSYPNRSRQGALYEISISILKFERFDHQNVRLEAVIEIFHKNHLQLQLETSEVVQLTSRKTSSEVEALSSALFRLSQLIADSIFRLPLSQCHMIVIDKFEVENQPLNEVLDGISKKFIHNNTSFAGKMNIVNQTAKFNSTDNSIISLNVQDTTLFDILQIISRKSGSFIKFSSTDIVLQ